MILSISASALPSSLHALDPPTGFQVSDFLVDTFLKRRIISEAADRIEDVFDSLREPDGFQSDRAFVVLIVEEQGGGDSSG